MTPPADLQEASNCCVAPLPAKLDLAKLNVMSLLADNPYASVTPCWVRAANGPAA